MLRRVIAALLLTLPLGVAHGQGDRASAWGLATMPNGCMVQATSPQGTMISVWGFAGQDKLAFLLQNRDWNVRDGQIYKLDLDFLGMETLPVDATARQHIDSDGPGFLFTLQPGARGATGFLTAFTSAAGVRITQGRRNFDTLSLAGSKTAMATLAKCLAEEWSKAAQAAGAQESDEPEEEGATGI